MSAPVYAGPPPTVTAAIHWVANGNCRAALITALGDDGCVDLVTFTDDGTYFAEGTWHWPIQD